MKRKLPIGIQTFEKLRAGNFLYIDKTQFIYELMESGGYYFLSRPRRFGKSLLLSTIKELFEGNKALFKGLWVESRWNWEKRNPVIRFSFDALDYQGKGLETALLDTLQEQAGLFQITLNENTFKSRFGELIEKLGGQNKVVILIDEYDKPIIDYLSKEKRHIAIENQNTLKTFYSIIKSSDPYIKFLLITGVSKFSKMGVFSDLNNLEDISIDDNFAAMLGYTQNEIERYFTEYAAEARQKHGLSPDELKEKIKDWYNGYSWDGETFVYNPHSVLNFFKKLQFQNFWFQSGTPTFLVNLLKERFYYDFEEVNVGMASFESYDLENLETVPLLFQTGYLTIKGRERNLYSLGYPNYEVKESMLQHLMGAFRHGEAAKSTALAYQVETAFIKDDVEEAIRLINGMFATIPYQLFEANKESYYHSLIHLLFTYVGLYLHSEISNNRGRTDMALHTDTHIYVLEFKLDESAAAAIQQIREKGYAERYRNAGKPVVGLGVNFSSKNKAVDAWEREEL